jgi:tetratricopeptide (TPR) repeat protein
MAVNAHEQVQVGHYYLMRREYENAWKWYELAATDREKPQAIKLSEIEQFMRQIRIHRDSNFFEYYCLAKLGRYEQAEMRLKQFRTAMSVEIDMQQLSELGDQWQGREEEARQELVKLVAFAEPLIQSAYITEVYLSLDAIQDGIAFFERELESATDNPGRLAALLCLSQLLLISNEHEAYSELATSQLAPLLIEMLESTSLTLSIDFTNLIEQRSSIQEFIILTAGGIALKPMASQEFLAGLSYEELHSHVADWRELDRQTQNDAGHWIVDSALAALLQQLDDDEFHRIEARRSANPLKAMLEFVDTLSP